VRALQGIFPRLMKQTFQISVRELKENDINLVQTDLSEQALVTAIRANMCGFFH
jgi:hypothetical protein